MIATGFTPEAKETFKSWLQDIWKYGEPTDDNIQAFFNSLEYADWEIESNTTIEVSRTETESGNPETYLVTREMVEFIEV